MPPTFTAEDLALLTVPQLLSACRDVINIPANVRRAKVALLEWVMRHLDTDRLQERLEDAVESWKSARERRQREAGRRRVEMQRLHRQAARLQRVNFDGNILDNPEDYAPEQYLDLPDEEDIWSCHRAFQEATGNAAMQLVVCAICAREFNIVQDGVEVRSLSELPHRERLAPHVVHEAQHIIDGCLLEPAGIISHTDADVLLFACTDCRDSLQKDTPTTPPPYALANNMWIGDVPWELACLTFPEQLLLAQLYPRAYVFKLFPKWGNKSMHNEDECQRALRGTVSTYALDIDSAAAAALGQRLPRPLEVLPKIMSITYVGPGKLPERRFREMFKVRRAAVLRALLWLKQHNYKYYGDIVLDDAVLASLPEDDIPTEILAIIRHNDDASVAAKEHAGYVPETDAEPEHDEEESQLERRPENSQHQRGPNELGPHVEQVASAVADSTHAAIGPFATADDEPDVIPLFIAGTADTDLTTVSGSTLMAWGMANLVKLDREPEYAVRHSRLPVNDFPNHDPSQGNFYERAFPVLFPYGTGGIESARPVPLGLGQHTRWALMYHDRRFRTHESFPFVVFSITQKRQALLAARLQVNRHDYDKIRATLAHIDEVTLREASEQEARHERITDPNVRRLLKYIRVASGSVEGSDQSRVRLRSQIWSTCLKFAAPSLWLTINPADEDDPLVQVLAGADIDLDAFVASQGPTSAERKRSVASDPYASAKFFHYIIQTVCEKLFGIEVGRFRVKSSAGVLGKVDAYFGTVESQGRGTLHFHCLLWLADTPSMTELQQMLTTAAFRDRVRTYIHRVIRAYLPGLESREALQTIPKTDAVAWSRPPDPDGHDYATELHEFERRVARMQQLHSCHRSRCLVYDRKGRLRCKRRAPFPTSDEDFIAADGTWRCKRPWGYINNWNPSVLTCMRCNHDIKLLTNGAETKNISYYVTTYATKKQAKTHNLSALLAEGYSYHVTHPNEKYLNDIKETNRVLIFRLIHTIDREQEIAAPMIISYLMGWGDVKASHSYSPLYWSSFVRQLFETFPELTGLERLVEPVSADDLPRTDSQDATGETFNERVSINTDRAGEFFIKNQVSDYSLRGEELEDLSVLDFFADTYEELLSQVPTAPAGSSSAHAGGRPRNLRAKYMEPHPRRTVVQRVVRSKGHRTLPNIIGKWLPRRDDPELQEYYAACVLLLLKPWRHLREDLRVAGSTWSESLRLYITSLDDVRRHLITRTIDGIQYFHDCRSAAEHSRDNEEDFDDSLLDDIDLSRRTRTAANDYDELLDEDPRRATVAITPDLVAQMRAPDTSSAEYLHGRTAVVAAKEHGIFALTNEPWTVCANDQVQTVCGDDVPRLRRWQEQMSESVDTATTMRTHGTEHNATSSSLSDIRPEVEPIPPPISQQHPQHTTNDHERAPCIERALEPANVNDLKVDQRRAYEIVKWHLDQKAAGLDPPPLRMIIYGEGGTGKSKVIQTLTELFNERGKQHALAKGAYTGIAASLVDGNTLHTLAGMPTQKSKLAQPMSPDARERLEAGWRRKECLIVDEFSMMGKAFFAAVSRNISCCRQGSPGYRDMSFGGLDLILVGDLHQFPPIATGKSDYLYVPSNAHHATSDDGSLNALRELGRRIFEEFDVVVILTEQVRVDDPEWLEFLRALRKGDVQQHHITFLRSLSLEGVPENERPDFDSAPWNTASLVTPRHGVRRLWNEEAAKKWCRQSGNQLMLCPADDSVASRPLTLNEQYAMAVRDRDTTASQRRLLPSEVRLAIGMRILVTENVETELDITNGARGEIVGIMLDDDEPQLTEDPIVTLQRMPACILVKMERTKAPKLDGLPQGVIPVVPRMTTCRIKVPIEVDGNQRTVDRTVRRRQFPITEAYAFTDYRAQGQTLPYTLIDIASPPSGKLNLFNLYVALSRSRGRQTIRLLRDFDEKIFHQAHDPELLKEDDRLELLNRKTMLDFESILRTAVAPPATPGASTA